jgi:hypothetical protein
MMHNQQEMMQDGQEGRHYFDSIETDKFEMPTVFPVDILLADNQVRVIHFNTFLAQNSSG